MKSTPILFSGPMVRAILDGRKTQTRRVFKVQPADDFCPEVGLYCPTLVDPRTGEMFPGKERFGASDLDECHPCPYGQPGDRLWVRETWQDTRSPGEPENRRQIMYRADDSRSLIGWRPSIFMPRWASRITLEITGVRAERLQEISDDDAFAEGIQSWVDSGHGMAGGGSARGTYRALWESINGPGSWDANPWAWVVEFRRLKTAKEEKP